MDEFEEKVVDIITAIAMFLIIAGMIGCIGAIFYWLWIVLF